VWLAAKAPEVVAASANPATANKNFPDFMLCSCVVEESADRHSVVDPWPQV
jgi:hypothetical protein